MSIDILMPALSPTMEEGKLSKWLKKEGDKVSSGDIIAEIETDKAMMEVEAVDEGTLGRICVLEGSEGVKVNTVIAVLLEEGETVEDISQSTNSLNTHQKNGGASSSFSSSVPQLPILDTLPDSDIPAGTKMVTMTVREALNQAMAEEMRRDEMVFLLGKK